MLTGHLPLTEHCKLPVGTIHFSMEAAYNSSGSVFIPALHSCWGKVKVEQRNTTSLPSGALCHIFFPKHFQEKALCWQSKRLTPASPVYIFLWAWADFNMVASEARLLVGFWCTCPVLCSEVVDGYSSPLGNTPLLWNIPWGNQSQPPVLSTSGLFQYQGTSCEPRPVFYCYWSLLTWSTAVDKSMHIHMYRYIFTYTHIHMQSTNQGTWEWCFFRHLPSYLQAA